ncbi:hypothetical protein PTI98_002224 [Pleurotus ostreatus]|nr:hypothetical protein PTI98_002224 [Pleurotus ostreatus]
MLLKRDSRSSWRGRYIIGHFSAASGQRTSRQNHRPERRGGMSSNSSTSPRPNILFGGQWITKIRHSAKLVGSLPPEMQRTARDAYAISLKQVFIFASVATFFAYLVRLPIPEKALEHQPRPIPGSSPNQQSPTLTSIPETPFDSEDDEDEDEIVIAPGPKGKIARRLSGYESADGVMDLESNASRRLHQR